LLLLKAAGGIGSVARPLLLVFVGIDVDVNTPGNGRWERTVRAGDVTRTNAAVLWGEMKSSKTSTTVHVADHNNFDMIVETR
jgi:hypothetical protein